MRAHKQVIHPARLLKTEKRWLGRANDWAATHLAAFFGLVWTVWLFILVPLMLLVLPKSIQAVGFFISSGWIQLWALPLLNYVGNKGLAQTEAQSEVQHQALTHIATVGDDVKRLIEINNDLTAEIHDGIKHEYRSGP